MLVGIVLATALASRPVVSAPAGGRLTGERQRPMYGLCFSPFLAQDPHRPAGVPRQAATNSIGVTSPSRTWYLAEGSTGSDQNGVFETWVLVQNPGAKAASVGLRYMTPSGPVEGPSFNLPPHSRQSVNVAQTVPGQFSVSTVVSADQPVVAERAMYWNAGLTVERIAALLDEIAPYTDWIRTFSATGICERIPELARKRGLKVAAGCDLSADPAYNEAEVNGLAGLARSGNVDIAVVGEESLYYNFVPERQLIDYIRRVRATGVPTTTSDTWGDLLRHPAVIAECDMLFANMYPYWEQVDIGRAVSHVEWCYQQTLAGAGGKAVLVETGWPTAGDPKGPAVPGQDNANRFLAGFTAWAKAHRVPYFYFEAFDEPWKAGHEGPVGAHWGLWDRYAVMKPGVSGILTP